MAVKGEGSLFELVRTPDGDRDAWLEQRRKGVGGSDVAAIMGLSPYRGAYEVWAEKMGLVEAPDISDKPAVTWGNVLEPVVGRHYAENHPDRDVRRLNAVCRSIARPWAQASLDYEVRDPGLGWGVLEIKTAGLRSAGHWEDGVPLFYQTQVAHYLSVTGRPFADVAVLIGGQDYREYRIMRDEGDIAAVDGAVDAFWERVRTGEEPPADGSPGEAEALFRRHPKDDGEVWECPGMPVEVADYVYCKEVADAAKKRLDAASDALKQLIGERRGIACDGYVVTWARGTKKRFDSKAFREDHPDLYGAYTTEGPANMGLRIKERKK